MLVKDYILLHHGADDSLINIISNYLLTIGLDYGLIASVNTKRQKTDSEDSGSDRISSQPVRHTNNRHLTTAVGSLEAPTSAGRKGPTT